MAAYRDRSLGHKLRSIVLAGIAVALVISFVAIGVSEVRQEVAGIQGRANIYAELVVENGSAPMRFEDAGSAERLLGSLRFVEEIRAAVLLRANGEVFASYPATLTAEADRRIELTAARDALQGTWAFPRYLRAWPVRHDGEQLGVLVLEISLANMVSELAEWMLLALGGLFVGGLAATMLVRRAEHSIVRPILQLAAMVRDVRNHGRYDLRAPAGPRDEVGELIDGVNSMLTEIEARDTALAAHRDRLELEVAHRTEELSLAKEEADHARDEAQAANRAKSLFLANMSHEIRTPMNGVMGMVELLRGTPMNERQQRMIDTLHGSAESLLYLINDVLDVSKIEAGKLELDPLDFSPRQAVEDVALLFAERAQAKGVDLMLLVSADVPDSVFADGHRFRQVLNNLVSNAVKFTASGFVRIELDAAIEGETVVLSGRVTDSGIGVSAEMQPRLFQAFSQADNSMARRYGGTGLGLVISRQLVELLGGKLDFTSTAGEGASFFFTIRAELRRAAPPPDGVPQRVGVVAAKRALRETLVAQLAAFGCRVEAFDGEPALQAALAAGHGFDTLLVDGVVAGESGHALMLRHKDDGPRIVALTRMNALSEEEDARQSGARLCVAKPVLTADLRAALRGESGVPAPARRHGVPALKTDARVLLAEDHPVNAEIACALLGECGCRVTVANNGHEAVAAFQHGAFDLVLMDIQMPEMDGIEATQKIRQLERAGGGERVPIVALTANALRDDRSAALAAGMDDYLTKPVTGDRLREALVRWLPATRTHAVAADEAVAVAALAVGDDNEVPALDRDVLLGVPGVNGDIQAPLLTRLVGLFMRETQTQLDVLTQALADDRLEDAQRQVHKMKSAAAAVGAARLARHARALDADLKQGPITDGDTQLAGLRDAFAAYASALKSSGLEMDGVLSAEGGQPR